MDEDPDKKPSPIWHSDVPGMFILLIQPVLALVLVGILFPVLTYVRERTCWNMFPVLVSGVILVIAWRIFRRVRRKRDDSGIPKQG